MRKLKVVFVGAGSMCFGEGIIVDLVSSEELRERELEIILVDIDRIGLDRMYKFANVLKDYYKSKAVIKATMDRKEAFLGAKYVITAVAKRKHDFWQKDYYIPAAYGFKHVLGENGGPGAAFHTLRSLNLMIPLCKDMEKFCPDAMLMNFTNPESRVCMGVSKLTKIKNVGLCHGPMITLSIIAKMLKIPENEIDLTIAGLNHFHWVLKIINNKNGEDLYSKLDASVDGYNWGDDSFTPVLHKVFGLLPFPQPSHTGEYINFAYDAVHSAYVKSYGEVSRDLNSLDADLDSIDEGKPKMSSSSYELWFSKKVEIMNKILKGEIPVSSEDAPKKSGELAVPIICDIEFNHNRRELGGNVLNKDFSISNLPEDAIVEVPLIVNSDGVKPEKVGPLPTAIAGMCNNQVYIQKLLVEAYEKKSKKVLFQAIAIDPIIDNLDRAKKMMETMLNAEADYLPELY